jgi:hypothetical protein
MRECYCRNWQIFDLNIIAHFLAKRIFDKSANFEKYSLREIDDVKTEFRRIFFLVSGDILWSLMLQV